MKMYFKKRLKMKKHYLLLIVFALISFPGILFAQNKDAMRKIESARIALITERLGLTPAQAERFWPLYNEFSRQKRDIRSEVSNARSNIDPKKITEQQSQLLMNLRFEAKQKELNLEKEYANRLRDVISSQQLLSLRHAEDDFKRMLLQRIDQRRRQQLNRDRLQQRQEYMRKQGNN